MMPGHEYEQDPAAVAVLDLLALERLRGFGGDKLVRDMIELFLASAPPRIADAVAAAAAGNCEGVRRALHSLNSSAAQLGASRMQPLCEHGEVLAAEQAAAELHAIVTGVAQEFDHARIALEAANTLFARGSHAS